MTEGAGTRSHDAPAPYANGSTATVVEEPPMPVFTTTAAVVDEPPVITIPDVDEAPRPVEAQRPPAKPLTVAIDKGIRRATGEVDEHLVSLITPDTFEADQYRVLRHTVEQRRRTAGLGIIAVTSAGQGDGKTTTAINLAGALAQDRASRVLLIDCDLRSSAMARRLGLAEGRGLVQAIVDPMLALDDAIRHLPRFNLDVMAAGFETASPYELLKSPRLGDLFEAARRRYDYVVVDTPPLVPFPDCRVLAKVVDGFLIVVSAHRTPRRLIDEALDVLPKEAIVGLVFNGDNQALSRSYQSYYGDDGGAAADTTWRSSAKRAWARVGGA
jgi:capsular exopolysaccharide synthesis family protein